MKHTVEFKDWTPGAEPNLSTREERHDLREAVHDAFAEIRRQVEKYREKGTHVHEPGLEIVRGRRVSFHADRPFAAYADGDPIAELPATVEILPGTLRVLAP